MSAPSRDDFAATLDAANRIAQQWLSGLDGRAAVASPARTPALAAQGIGEDAALALLRERIEPHLSASPGPRYWGFVTGGATPAALAGDWLASAYDQNVSHDGGSIAAAVERDAIAGLRALLGLSDVHSGWFTSGATQSNTSALAAARQALLARRGHDASELGLTGAPRVRVLAGAAHASIGKALSILGMGRRALEPVATIAGRTAVDVAALESALAAGDAPTIVVASAGEVNTGDCDDIAAIAALCRAHGAWLHVDGAFGLWARASRDPSVRARVDGVERADSWATDGHKWPNVPYDCGVAIVRDRAAHERSMAIHASYLPDSADARLRNPFDWTPELSRRARGFALYAALAELGRSGMAALVDRTCAFARRFRDELARVERVSILNEVDLNQVLVRFEARSGEHSDAHTRDVVRAIHDEGTCYATGTTWRGLAALRISVCNASTDDDDVTRSIAAIASAHLGRSM